MRAATLVVVVGVLSFAACDDDATTTGVRPAPAGKPWATLAEWQLFEDAALQVPAAGVMRYEVISPLFTDYAVKRRFVWLPDGKQITAHDDGTWDLPIGAIVIKSFAYPIDARDPAKGERILETRLLVHEPSGWVPHTYVWDEAQTKATRKVAGTFIQAAWVDVSGAARTNRYTVPTINECFECHSLLPNTKLLGLKTPQVDRVGLDGENQIDRFAAAGLFVSPPVVREPFAPPAGEAPLELRARAYLDANCAHCHSPSGDAGNKALYLDFAHTAPGNTAANWGICKLPTSAGGATCGHSYDVVPGDADSSVMVCRMESTVGADQMPPIGRGLVDVEGVALIRAWIDAMPGSGCGAQ